MEVPGTPIGASFFEFELKPTGKDSADHKHDESSKDVFSITDMAAGIFFWKFCTISKEAAKRYILSPQITFSSSSLFLLIRLRLPSPGWDGNLRLKRRKNEEKEKVKWGDKMCLFAYDAKFSTKNPSDHIYDIKGIFWAYIMFMVHIPFKIVIDIVYSCPCYLRKTIIVV